MPCSYDRGDNFECQFKDKFQEDELMEVDGKQWCPFHAPLEDGNGNPTEKEKWENDKKWNFQQRISKFRESALEEAGERLNLRGVIFPGKAYFKGLEFPEVDFSRARLKGGADFSGATFSGSAFFKKTLFSGRDVNFKNAVFSGSADFRDARFSGENAKNALFSGAEFKEDAYFSHAEFKRHADFQKAQFNRNADFSDAKFTWHADFRNTKFTGGAIFKKAKFKWSALFQNTRFSGGVYFPKAQFNEKADFTSPGNNDDLYAFHGEVHFESAEFQGEPIFEVTFENRNFQQKTSFRGCTFEKAPRFHGCRLHQETDFKDARFWDRQGEEATKAYRTLRLYMEEKRARLEELKFFALEMESWRRTEKRKFLKFILWLFEVTADYGQSSLAPVASALMVFVLSMIVYSLFFLASPIADFEKTDIVILTSRFSLEQFLIPFGTVENSPSLSEFVENAKPSNLWSFSLDIVSTIQRVLSSVFLFLCARSVRWPFQDWLRKT